MNTPYTTTQRERLLELGASGNTAAPAASDITAVHAAPDIAVDADAVFEDAAARDAAFRNAEKQLVAAGRARIDTLLNGKYMPDSAVVTKNLETWLTDREGFTKVMTPTIIPTEMLDRMTLTEDEPLRDQVFYVGKNRCLRPMLAPNLYIMMRELGRIAKEPVRIFEAGSCFRRESQGARHLNEFTMLNCVEYGVSYGEEEGKGSGQTKRLEELARSAMAAVGIDRFVLEREASVVYGETIDIVVDGVELASCSYGPHVLDANWGVFTSWVGIGFGIERIAMVLGGHKTIKRVGRSIAFIDGVPLNI
jgi:phenylalanyl-tRNA synthetase alpha chain